MIELGGKPNPGTKPDKRLAENKSSSTGTRSAKTPKPKKGVKPLSVKKE